MKFFAAVVVFIATAGAQATWKDCSSAGAHGKVKDITITPAQPVKGQTFKVTGTGTVDEVVSASKYTLKISLNNIPIFTHTGDNCHPDSVKLPLGMGEVDLGGVKCPTTAGETVDLNQSVEVGKLSPNGNYVTTFSALDQASAEVFCVQISFTMSAEESDEVEEKPLKLRTKTATPAKIVTEFVGVPGPNGHYEDPLTGPCGSDETNVTVTGIPGSFCAPECKLGVCPKDAPTGVTAKIQCALEDQTTKKKFCALICTPGDSTCGADASCKKVPGQPTIGLCTYDK